MAPCSTSSHAPAAHSPVPPAIASPAKPSPAPPSTTPQSPDGCPVLLARASLRLAPLPLERVSLKLAPLPLKRASQRLARHTNRGVWGDSPRIPPAQYNSRSPLRYAPNGLSV